MKPFAFVCPHCRKVKKFQKWVKMPKKLERLIAKKEYTEDNRLVCPDCKKKAGTTNRLLPVVDKNEKQLAL